MDSEPSVPGHEPVRGGTGLKSRKWERISLRNCGTERSKSISVQRPVSCDVNTSIRVDPGRPRSAPKKRLVSIPADLRQGWQGSALAPSRNPVTQR